MQPKYELIIVKRNLSISDGDMSGQTTLQRSKLPQHSVIDELSDVSNQVVPDTGCVSGHSYSDHQHPGAQSHLSTFGATPPSMLQSRRMYGRYPGPGSGRNASTSLTDVTNGASSPDCSAGGGFVMTPVGYSGTATLPSWSAERRQQHAAQVPTVRYASTACVDALRHAGGGAEPPAVHSPSSPLTRRQRGPPVLAKPLAYDSACRLLGEEDSDCWGAETTATSMMDQTPYSCADVSAALRDVETPASGVRQPPQRAAADISAASVVVNPHQLCDEIDELFFAT